MNKQRDPLLAHTERIFRFEERLALSASPTADVLLELLDLDLLSASTSNDADSNDSLIEQANSIHEQHGFGGAGQTVAVIDSGIAYDHIALGEGYGPGYRVVGGWDFAENDADPYDDGPSGFHGTHVAGLLGGVSKDFQGIAPGADLVALRVFDDLGGSDLGWIEDALAWVHENQSAFENPITTVNLSLGATLPEELVDQIQTQLEDELSLLKADGILVFAAAGNAFDSTSPTEIAYPAGSSSVTAVGSTGSDDVLSEFSQRQEGVLTAPGEQVRSTVPDHVLGRDGRIDDFVNSTGTSMASPQVAGASIVVRDAMQTLGVEHDSQSILQHLIATADQRDDPETGIVYREVNLARAIDALFENYSSPSGEGEAIVDSNIQFVGDATNLGVIESASNNFESGKWYELQASRNGFLSFALESGEDRSFSFAIDDVSGNRLATSTLSPEGQVDVQVTAGQTIRFLVDPAGSSSVSVDITNQLAVRSDTVNFFGTQAADNVAIDLQRATLVSFGQFEYQFDAGTVTELSIDGSGGSDTIDVRGSTGAEKIELRVDSGIIENSTLVLSTQNFEKTNVVGGGGSDRAYLYDSSENDTLTARPGSAELSGAGFQFTVSEANSIYIHATAGGNDIAYLYDSETDDRLAIRPAYTSLRGDGYFNLVFGFDRVSAYGTAGGTDTANLYDSPGDDRMSANAKSAFISGPGFYSQARSFESVIGHANAGGNDYATLYADSAEQKLHNTGGLVQLDIGDDSVRAARGFERNETFLNGAPIVVSAQSIQLKIQPDDTSENVDLESGRILRAIDAYLPAVNRDTNQIANLLIPPTSDHKERETLDGLFAEL